MKRADFVQVQIKRAASHGSALIEGVFFHQTSVPIE